MFGREQSGRETNSAERKVPGAGCTISQTRDIQSADQVQKETLKSLFFSFLLSFLSGEQLWLMSNTATRCEGVCPHMRWCNKSNQIIISNQYFRISVADPAQCGNLRSKTAKTKINAAVLLSSPIRLLHSFSSYGTSLYYVWPCLSDPRVIHIVDSRKAFGHGKTCRKHPQAHVAQAA